MGLGDLRWTIGKYGFIISQKIYLKITLSGNRLQNNCFLLFLFVLYLIDHSDFILIIYSSHNEALHKADQRRNTRNTSSDQVFVFMEDIII